MSNALARSMLVGITGLALAIISAFCLSPGSLRAQNATGGSGYKLIRQLPIDALGAWDYLAIDPEARRLYISNDAGIIVFDVDAEKVVGNVPRNPYVPGRGFVHGVAV